MDKVDFSLGEATARLEQMRSKSALAKGRVVILSAILQKLGDVLNTRDLALNNLRINRISWIHFQGAFPVETEPCS